MATHWVFQIPQRHVERELVAAHGDGFATFAEGVAKGLGTKTFLIWQTVVVILWITLNLVGLTVWHWDPYPFILLNLGFSTQAAYAAPFIMFVGNRQEKRAKIRADIEFENDLRNRVYITALCHKLGVSVEELENVVQQELTSVRDQEVQADMTAQPRHKAIVDSASTDIQSAVQEKTDNGAT